jgi:hypothetical protein
MRGGNHRRAVARRGGQARARGGARVKTCLVVDAFAGAGGDMLLAAMIDAGAPIALLREQVLSIPALAKIGLDVETVRRGAFAATRLLVDLPHEHAHRGLADIVAIIDTAPSLSERTKSRAKDAFTRLAVAEAKVHGTTVEQVHFHEVGGLDAIVDVVGFFVCVETLGVGVPLRTALVVVGLSREHGPMPAPPRDSRTLQRPPSPIPPREGCSRRPPRPSSPPRRRRRARRPGAVCYSAHARANGMPKRPMCPADCCGSNALAVCCTIDNMNWSSTVTS